MKDLQQYVKDRIKFCETQEQKAIERGDAVETVVWHKLAAKWRRLVRNE